MEGLQAFMLREMKNRWSVRAEWTPDLTDFEGITWATMGKDY